MKKRIFLLFCFGFVLNSCIRAQKFPVAIGPSINHPIGDFRTTHSIGVGIECNSAKHWFEFKKGKKTSFSWKGGIAYYLGKKVITSGFSNKYLGYTFIRAFAGLQFIPIKKTVFHLMAGPALGLYSGSTRFNIGTEFSASYLIKQKLSAGPVIILMKESGADAIWSLGLKGLLKI